MIFQFLLSKSSAIFVANRNQNTFDKKYSCLAFNRYHLHTVSYKVEYIS